MVTVERVPDGERAMEMALAGWWRWTWWDWHCCMRKRQRSNESLWMMMIIVMFSMPRNDFFDESYDGCKSSPSLIFTRKI